VVFLAGEWVPAWLGLTLTFLVAALGVVGLGWWVLRKDKMNRAAEDAALDSQATDTHH
jgi:Flp pilus assembly protein TadG